MGVSTNGQICYGVLFEDGYAMPWDESRHTESEWYYRLFPDYPTADELYTEEGNLKEGVTQEELITRLTQRRAYRDKKEDLPFEAVNVCSCDYPMYILAVPGTTKSAARGYLEVLDFNDLQPDPVALDKFLSFMSEHFPDIDVKLEWYLSSLWC